MQSVMLVSPPGHTSYKLYSMNEAGGLAAVLRQAGFSAEILDGDLPGVIEAIGRADPLMVVLVLNWPHQIYDPWMPRFLEGLASTDCHISVEGKGASIYYNHILMQCPQVHSVILGEGENTVVELTQRLAGSLPWKDVKGIAYRKHKDVCRSEPRPPIEDLDALPFAARDYLTSNRKGYPVVPLYTTRSCRGMCTFCGGRIFRDLTFYPGYRARSAQHVVDEIEMLVKQYRAHVFYFVDDNFLDREEGKQRAKQIAGMILDRRLRIRFYIECRVDDVEEKLFSLLKRAGLRKAFVGIESGSQSVLDRYRKGTTVEMNRKAVQTLRALGINCDPGLILFDPHTTFEEVKENLRFIAETGLHRLGDHLAVFRSLRIYLGTEDEKRFLNKFGGYLPDGDGFYRQYAIADPKAHLVEATMRTTGSEINRQQALLTRIANQNPNLIPDFPIKMGRWKDSLPDLTFGIFEGIVQILDETPQVNKQVKANVSRFAEEKLTRHQMTHFGVLFQELTHASQGQSSIQETAT